MAWRSRHWLAPISYKIISYGFAAVIAANAAVSSDLYWRYAAAIAILDVSLPICKEYFSIDEAKMTKVRVKWNKQLRGMTGGRFQEIYAMSYTDHNARMKLPEFSLKAKCGSSAMLIGYGLMDASPIMESKPKMTLEKSK